MVSNGEEIGASKLTGEMLSMITKIQSTVATIVNDTTGSTSVGTLHTSRRASPFPWLTCNLLIRFLEANRQVKSLNPSNYPHTHPQSRTIFACACRHFLVSFSSLPFLQFPYVTFFIFLGPIWPQSLFICCNITPLCYLGCWSSPVFSHFFSQILPPLHEHQSHLPWTIQICQAAITTSKKGTKFWNRPAVIPFFHTLSVSKSDCRCCVFNNFLLFPFTRFYIVPI